MAHGRPRSTSTGSSHVLGRSSPVAQSDQGLPRIGLGEYRPADGAGRVRPVRLRRRPVCPSGADLSPPNWAELHLGYAPDRTRFVDWPCWPYILTGYAILAPRQVSTVGRALNAPFGQWLYFAGRAERISDFSDIWRGAAVGDPGCSGGRGDDQLWRGRAVLGLILLPSPLPLGMRPNRTKRTGRACTRRAEGALRYTGCRAEMIRAATGCSAVW
jgi:hypothetical protein